ncbi:MAG: hypothetical protein AAFV30_11080, partial [Pseudomonadota bacterium]
HAVLLSVYVARLVWVRRVNGCLQRAGCPAPTMKPPSMFVTELDDQVAALSDYFDRQTPDQLSQGVLVSLRSECRSLGAVVASKDYAAADRTVSKIRRLSMDAL